jgi:hypothetical protein
MDIDVRDSFEAILGDLIELLPRVLLFLVILLVGWIIAKLVEKAVDALLERLGFDRLVERGGVGRMTEHTGYDPSSIAAKLVYLAVIIITLQLAFAVFGPNPISDLLASIVAWLPLAFVAIIIIVVAVYLAGIVRDIIRGALGGTTYGSALAMVAYVFIIGLGVIAALAQVGVAVIVTGPILVAVLATIAGVAIVGIGGGLIPPMQRRWERILLNAEVDFARRNAAMDDRVRMETAGVRPTTVPPRPAGSTPPPAGPAGQRYPGSAT